MRKIFTVLCFLCLNFSHKYFNKRKEEKEMDKETLSNYGWVVICILVLSVMIALATPFGTYVSNAVKSTTRGLNDTSDKAMSVIGLNGKGEWDDSGNASNIKRNNVIPDGGVYYRGGEQCLQCLNHTVIKGLTHPSCTYVSETEPTAIYTSGQQFPSDLKFGDIYVEGDFAYSYGNYKQGWSVVALNNQKYYGIIVSEISNKPVISMDYTFKNCSSLITSPIIPSTINTMIETFYNCYCLTIDENLIIPEGVTNMDSTFFGCAFLFSKKGTLTINANPRIFSDVLNGVPKQGITLAGSSSKLNEILATAGGSIFE